MNKLFWILSRYKISLTLRNFSFLLQLGFMTCTQNISLLNYYFLQNLSTIFSLDLISKMVNLMTILLYGLFIIFCCVFLPLSYVLYKKLSIYFLNDCKLNKGSFIYCFLKFIFRPLIESFIHIYLFENQKLQLCFLGISSLIFLLGSLIFELSFGFTENKTNFTLSCSL